MLKSKFYEDREMQDIMKEYYQIVSTFNTDFLEDYFRYKAEKFSILVFSNGLSNDISHFIVGYNFLISTCLSEVLTIDFLEDGNRYKVEIFSVN